MDGDAFASPLSIGCENRRLARSMTQSQRTGEIEPSSQRASIQSQIIALDADGVLLDYNLGYAAARKRVSASTPKKKTPTPTAADGHNTVAMLVRRDGETLNALLRRLDKAIGMSCEHDEWSSKVWQQVQSTCLLKAVKSSITWAKRSFSDPAREASMYDKVSKASGCTPNTSAN